MTARQSQKLRLNALAYADVKTFAESLTTARNGQAAQYARSDLAVAMLYKAEELLAGTSLRQREPIAELAFQIAENIAAPEQQEMNTKVRRVIADTIEDPAQQPGDRCESCNSIIDDDGQCACGEIDVKIDLALDKGDSA